MSTGEVLRAIALDPVGGVPATFRRLEKRRAMEVGIACAIVGALCVVIGVYMTLPSWSRNDVRTIFGLLVLGATLFGGLIGAGYLARTVFGGAGAVEGDVFVAATSLVPIAVMVFLAGLVGVANFEVVGLLGIFASTWTILMLHAGVSRVSGVAEGKAAFAVPLMLILSLWLTSIVFRGML